MHPEREDNLHDRVLLLGSRTAYLQGASHGQNAIRLLLFKMISWFFPQNGQLEQAVCSCSACHHRSGNRCGQPFHWSDSAVKPGVT